jgi:hypothetical protein
LIFVKICQLAKKEAIEEVVPTPFSGFNSCAQVPGDEKKNITCDLK